MGAFDLELAELGIANYRSEPTADSVVRAEVEPQVGMRVYVSNPGDNIIGTVAYVGRSLVVIERDAPRKRIGLRPEYETEVPRHWTFYEA